VPRPLITSTPTGSVEPNIVERYEFISTFAGVIAMAVGVLVLLGWIFRIEAIVSVVPGFATMKVNTAVCIFLSGFSLLLLRSSVGRVLALVPRPVQLGQMGGLFVALIALLSLVEYASRLDFGIDQFPLQDTWTDPRIAPPGRMSIATAFGFLMLGSSLFILGRKGYLAAAVSQILALIGLGDAVIGCLGYIYGVHGLYAMSVYTSMAAHTALVLLLLGIGVLFAQSGRGLIADIMSKHDGGRMARHILPLAVTLPFVIGWLRLQGEHAGLYGTEFGLALFATSNIIMFTILVWVSARTLNVRARELVQSDYRHRFLADTMPQIIWAAKPDGNVDYFNQRWINYTGLSLDETKNWDWKRVVHPDDLDHSIACWTKSITTGCDYEVEYRFKRGSDGAYRWHLGRAFAQRNDKGEVIEWVGTCTDIDDHKQARQQLEKRVAERTAELAGARERLQAVLDAATHVSIIATTPEGRITLFNAGAEQLLGYREEEMIDKQIPAILHLESEVVARGQELSEELGRPISGFDVFVEPARHGKYDEREWTYVRKDGGHLMVNLIVTASRDASGEITGFLGVATDVSARRKAEETLRISEERFRLIVDAVRDYALLMLDSEGHVVSWNLGAERINGYREEEILGRHFSCFYLPEDIERGHPEEELCAAARDGRYVEEGWRVRKDGSPFWADVIITAIRDEAGKLRGFAKVTRDVTDVNEAERKLRDQALILDLANDSIFIRDIEDRITYWNRGAQRLYGWSKEEAIGRFTHFLLRTEFPQPIEVIRGQLLAQGHWKGELVHTRRDGSRAIVASSWTLQRDESDEPISVIEMNEDITARKESEQELAQSRERLNVILNSSLDGVIVYEAERDEAGAIRDFRFTMVNPTAEKLLGMTASDLLGRSLIETFPSIVTDGLFDRLVRITGEGGNEDFEYMSMRRSTPRWYRIAGVKLGDGLVMSYTEITARKQTERQLREAKERAESADTAKGEFLANMSHEIRTPMNGVLGMTGLLLDTGLDAEQRSLAETIRTSAESLLSLINGILDFSKIEAGKLTFEELDFNLRKVVEDTMEMMAAQAQAKGIELVSSVEPDAVVHLRGDPGRVHQLLTNLIGNAIKFTKSGEVATRVTIDSESETDVIVRFEIRDTGVGISRQAKARLFQPFVQADNSTARMFGGTGLGLAICKSLAESMKGDIGVESQPGRGSRFWVTLKFSRQPGAELEPKSVLGLADSRVLVVDDNKTNRQFLTMQMLAWRMRNGSAAEGEEALAMLRKGVTERDPYLAAIIDMQMPGSDGLALAREIKSDPLLGATQIILLTPFGKPLSSTEAKAINIAASCIKPVRQSALYDCLVQALAIGGNAVEERGPDPSVRTAILPPVRKERVLLAEDNLVNQQVALGNLRKLGYTADVAANGIEVLEALVNERYDIILMDCQMPDLDGYQATREIRRREKNGRHTWIIAMTANVMVGDREKCLAAGMDDYVGKPLRRAELKTALERAVTTSVAPLDPKVLQNLADEGEDDLAELIELFVETAPQSIADMRRALEKSDAKALTMAAHTLKGSCSHWGDSPLRELCARIEALGREGQLTGVADKIASAEVELYRFTGSLAPYRKPKLSS
jgi:two-component system, sensor histidine kinase and response regulator